MATKTIDEINGFIEKYSPISLDQMKGIRLMNRDDKKYIATTSDLMNLLYKAPEYYFIQEIDGGVRSAHYQTIYYDTPDNQIFLLHQNGKKTREKIRVRRYVDSSIAFCEIKRKNNHGRTSKTRIECPVEDVLSFRETYEFLGSNARFSPELLKLSLFNDFRRITLVNKQMTERVTIDFDIMFKSLKNGSERELCELAVVEIKRDGNTQSPISDMLLDMRIHPSRFSKYCIGSLLTNKELKHNNFKKDLMKMDKLTDYKYGYTC